MLLFIALSGLVLANLPANCTTGDYAILGTNTGNSIKMDYSNTKMSVDGGGNSKLTVVFDVPSLYYHDSSFAVTFHDRDGGNQGQCFTTKANNTHCVNPSSSWSNTDGASECDQVVTGVLDFNDLLRNNHGDKDLVIMMDDTRSINGFDTPTWEIYMSAMVETWASFSEQSNLAGNGDLNFNGAAQDLPANHLQIDEERYSFYYVPFRISIPKQITIVANSIRSSARLVSLYAIIKQQTLDINFTPSDGVFGTMDLTLKTQTQYPFALRGFNDANANATIAIVSGDLKSVAWTSMENNCAGNVNVNGYCTQEWGIHVVPNKCDISGTFEVNFWAECFTNADGCALDTKFDTTSNSWSGVLPFSITAQEFCPAVLDEVTVQGSIAKYVDSDFTEQSNPGVNTFSNDHVYFEVTFTTKSQKSGKTFAEGDDSLIAFVRPTKIEMDVALKATPLQYSVNRNNGDVTGSDTDYNIVLCTSTPLDYPYTSSTDDCFANKGWTANDYLAFTKLTGAKVDANEIAFSLRLDERVIPVDLPNSESVVTIKTDVEIYYNGNANPARRQLTIRRELGDIQFERKQTKIVSDSFGIKRKPLSFCTLNENLAYTGFKLNMKMDSLKVPTADNVAASVMEAKFHFAQYLNIPHKQVEVFQINRCIELGCNQLYPTNLGYKGDSFSSVDYYLEVRNKKAAAKLQSDIYDSRKELLESTWMQRRAVQSMSVDHCDSELQKVFNQYRSKVPDQDIYNEHPTEESSAATWTLLSLLSLALLY